MKFAKRASLFELYITGVEKDGAWMEDSLWNQVVTVAGWGVNGAAFSWAVW